MHQHQRRLVTAALMSLAAIIAVAVVVMIGSMRAAAQSAESPSDGAHHAQQIVNMYLGVVNAGMASSNCDFSQLSEVYPPDARLTLTGGPFAPGGPFGSGGSYGEQQFQGINAITAAYTQLCHILISKGKGAPQWTQDAGLSLAPNVLNSYEHVSFSGQPAGRCMHVFTINDDRIASLDWSVYA